MRRTYDATPSPKWVIASGACTRDGHVFKGSYAVVGGLSEVLPVDIYIPGCPPRPEALIDALMALQRKIDAQYPIKLVQTLRGTGYLLNPAAAGNRGQ